MSDDALLRQLGTGSGLVAGAGLGVSVAVLVGTDIGITTGVGIGAGVVIGWLAGVLARANRDQDHLAIRIVGGSAIVGILVGAGAGLVGAWSVDAALAAGVGVGLAGGLVHGGLVGVLLYRAGIG